MDEHSVTRRITEVHSAVHRHYERGDYTQVVRLATSVALALEGNLSPAASAIAWDMSWRVAASLCLVGAWDDAFDMIASCEPLKLTDAHCSRRAAIIAGISFLREDEQFPSMSDGEILGVIGCGGGCSHGPRSDNDSPPTTAHASTQCNVWERWGAVHDTPLSVASRLLTYMEDSEDAQNSSRIQMEATSGHMDAISTYFSQSLVIPNHSSMPTSWDVGGPMSLFQDEKDVCWSPSAATTLGASQRRSPLTTVQLLCKNTTIDLVGSDTDDVGKKGVLADVLGMYIESVSRAIVEGSASEMEVKALIVILLRTTVRQRAYALPLPSLFLQFAIFGKIDSHIDFAQRCSLEDLATVAHFADSEVCQSTMNLRRLPKDDWNNPNVRELLGVPAIGAVTDNLISKEMFVRSKLWDTVWSRYHRSLIWLQEAVSECLQCPLFSLLYRTDESHPSQGETRMTTCRNHVFEKLDAFSQSNEIGVDGLRLMAFVDFDTSATWNSGDNTPSFLRTWLATSAPRRVQSFLLFATGMSCLPSDGLSAPIHVVRDDRKLFARTCFYELLMPEYGSFEDFAEALEVATTQTSCRHASAHNMGEL